MRHWVTFCVVTVVALSAVIWLECAHRAASPSPARVTSGVCDPASLDQTRDQENAAGLLDCANQIKGASRVAH